MAARYGSWPSPVCKRRTPTGVATSIQRKYRRIRERPSPLSDTVRRKLLAKASGSSDLGPETSEEPTPAVPLQPRLQQVQQPADSVGQSGNVIELEIPILFSIYSFYIKLPTEGSMPLLDELRHALSDKYKCLSAEEVRDGLCTWIIIYRYAVGMYLHLR